MATYTQRDILQYDDGELDYSSGDIQIAGVRESQRQLLINVLNTTRGNFFYDPNLGWGGDGFIGRPNDPLTHQSMREDLRASLRRIPDLAMEDIFFTVSWLDHETAGVILRHSGIFIEQDGSTPTDTLILGWKFPYKTGQIELEE